MASTRRTVVPDTLPNYVHDVGTATCVFCPYGAEVEVGDLVYVYDEKTVLARQQRERLVEITAVKVFRSNGRMATLDLAPITREEMAHIATDSELSEAMLLDHHAGNPTYDKKHPPTVVYFKPHDSDDTTGTRTKPGSAVGLNQLPRARHESGLRQLWSRALYWLRT